MEPAHYSDTVCCDGHKASLGIPAIPAHPLSCDCNLDAWQPVCICNQLQSLKSPFVMFSSGFSRKSVEKLAGKVTNLSHLCILIQTSVLVLPTDALPCTLSDPCLLDILSDLHFLHILPDLHLLHTPRTLPDPCCIPHFPHTCTAALSTFPDLHLWYAPCTFADLHPFTHYHYLCFLCNTHTFANLCLSHITTPMWIITFQSMLQLLLS